MRSEIGMAPAAVSATVGDVGAEAGLEESIEQQGPLSVVGEVGFDLTLDGIGDAGDEGENDFPDALFPGRGDFVFPGVEVVFTGGAADLFLTGGRDGAVREAGVSAIGGEFPGGHAD